jgi:phage terminase large subunit
MTTIQIRNKWKPLLDHYEYVFCVGGRGGGKSYEVAQALVIKGMQGAKNILCTRQTEKSIADSVHALIKSIINKYQLTAYRVLDTAIRCITGSEFTFVGLLEHTVASVKSRANIDILFVEEAQFITKQSLDILLPTIRGKRNGQNPQKIFVWNPRFKSDAIENLPMYLFAKTGEVISTEPCGCKTIVNEAGGVRTLIIQSCYLEILDYLDDAFLAEANILKADNYEEYQHIYLGAYQTVSSDAYYKEGILSARAEGRVATLPQVDLPFCAVFDLGSADATAITIVQYYEMEGVVYYLFHDYFEFHYTKIEDDIAHIRKIYPAQVVFLPHDARNANKAGLSVQQTCESIGAVEGFEVVVIPRDSVRARIDLAKAKFSKCLFDVKCDIDKAVHQSQQQQDKENSLLHRLSNYVPEIKNGISKGPKHDKQSHGADAFGYAIQAYDHLPKPDVWITMSDA